MKPAIAEAKEQDHRFGFVTDTYMDVIRNHVDGIILTPMPKVFQLGTEAAGSDQSGLAMAMAKAWEEVLGALEEEYDIGIEYVLSDDSGQCGRARRILAYRWPQLLFILCWAHQVNLMVKALVQCCELKNLSRW